MHKVNRNILVSCLATLMLGGCVKEPYPDMPLPVITFSNDYNSTSYFQTSRVYQDTVVYMPNKVYMTASCSALAGIDETELTLNGTRVHYQKEQFQEFNREIDTLYKPQQTNHKETWVFKVTDKQGHSVSKQITIKIQ